MHELASAWTFSTPAGNTTAWQMNFPAIPTKPPAKCCAKAALQSALAGFVKIARTFMSGQDRQKGKIKFIKPASLLQAFYRQIGIVHTLAPPGIETPGYPYKAA